MHQLGFDLPERSGFDGLWSAMDEAPGEARRAPAAPRHVVAASCGAASPTVRRAIAAFLAPTAPAPTAAHDVAA